MSTEDRWRKCKASIRLNTVLLETGTLQERKRAVLALIFAYTCTQCKKPFTYYVPVPCGYYQRYVCEECELRMAESYSRYMPRI